VAKLSRTPHETLKKTSTTKRAANPTCKDTLESGVSFFARMFGSEPYSQGSKNYLVCGMNRLAGIGDQQNSCSLARAHQLCVFAQTGPDLPKSDNQHRKHRAHATRTIQATEYIKVGAQTAGLALNVYLEVYCVDHEQSTRPSDASSAFLCILIHKADRMWVFYLNIHDELVRAAKPRSRFSREFS
jgi:hypothetical protein